MSLLKTNRFLSIIWIQGLSCFISVASAQSEAYAIKNSNLDHFTQVVKAFPSYQSSEPLDSAEEHPEYGTLPYNAQCLDCFELIEKRTANTRYYISRSSPGHFYSQMAYRDLHYKDELNRWRTIDPRIEPTRNPDIFSAKHQSNPTTVDMANGFTSIAMWDGRVWKMNEDIRLFFSNDKTAESRSGHINRSAYSAGDDGVYVTEAFPGIDQSLITGIASIKSNYIVKSASALPDNVNWLIIEDKFDLPAGYVLKYDESSGTWNSFEGFFGELVLENAEGLEMGRYLPPFTFDSNSEDKDLTVEPSEISGYSISQVGEHCVVRIIVSANWLRAETRVYPVTIDPTVFGTTATWTGTSGANESPSWCTETLSVPVPPNATFTGSSIYWEYVATGYNCPPSCRLNDLQVRVYTSCGYSPSAAGVWICPGCNVAGTWTPTLDDATTAGLVSCFTPSCTTYDVDFTIQFNQFNCVTPGGCVTLCSYLQEFAVTIEGETVSGTAYADGFSAYTVTDCADQSGWLSPIGPFYGVPGYTYSWSPIGVDDDSVYVTWPMGTTTYTLTITDACGNTATDNVVVVNNCATLPLDLLTFDASCQDDGTLLNWSLSDKSTTQTFVVQRADDARNFTDIAEISHNGALQYQYTDQDAPDDGWVYYRLKDISGSDESDYSAVEAVMCGTEASLEISVLQADLSADFIELVLSPAEGTMDIGLIDLSGNDLGRHKAYVREGRNTIRVQLEHQQSSIFLLDCSLEQYRATLKVSL